MVEGTGGIASSRSVGTEADYAITITGREYVSGSGQAFTAREDARPPRIAPAQRGWRCFQGAFYTRETQG